MKTAIKYIAVVCIFLGLGFAGEDSYQQATRTEATKAQYLKDINGGVQ